MLIDPELYLAYVIATTLLVLMPGPIVTLVIANSLKHGMRTGILTSVGANLGTGILITAGGLGLTTIMAFAAEIFDWVRWAGALYLIYLGLREWRTALKKPDPEAEAGMRADKKAKGVFFHGLLVAVTNPKTMFFFVAFFPQFINPEMAAAPQIAIMIVTFIVIAFFLDGSYAVLAGKARGWLVGAKRARLRHGITGTLLLGTGLGIALARRS
jgi:homoserine/homoserine lactone efflux protein